MTLESNKALEGLLTLYKSDKCFPFSSSFHSAPLTGCYHTETITRGMSHRNLYPGDGDCILGAEAGSHVSVPYLYC